MPTEEACVAQRQGETGFVGCGGGASSFTTGLKSDFTIVDLPCVSELQHLLQLGLNKKMLLQLRKRRSNVTTIVIDDILCADLPRHLFDMISAVEVIEYIVDDVQFVHRLRELLARDRVLYLTTPNGDYVRNEGADYIPDRVRQCLKTELRRMLSGESADVKVW